jgi:hypothetical protein
MAETYQRPGWYPDPEGKPGERWWNGSTWSDWVRSAASAPAASSPPASSSPSVIYSAGNPAPQRPDPYARTLVGTTATPRSAFTIDARANRNAVIGLITGMIALFFNVFGVLGPVAIVFSALGVAKARQLKAQGVTNNSMVVALIGLGAGILATIIGIVTVVVFMVTLIGGITID